MSLGTSHSPRPKLTLASSPDLLLLPVFLSGMAPPSSVIGAERPRPRPCRLLPPPAHHTLWSLSPKYFFHMCLSLPPCVPYPGPGAPCSLSAFTSKLLPGLCPPPSCSEPTMAPDYPQKKAQVLAMAHVSQHHGTPLPSGTLCSSYSVSLALPPHSIDPCFPLLCFIACPTTPPPSGSPPGLSGWVRCALGSPFPALTLLGPHCQRDRFISMTGL